ncbi:site-specific integrase [Cyanobacteria bacterium FACHB-63]|nr:site-specific integrase [Cyanobacteria bacterium FACHB-63]
MTREEVNARLRAAKIGISVEQNGDRLHLRGIFPPKPGETKRKQREITLNVYANPSGFKRAEAEARKIRSQIDLNQFNWLDWDEKLRLAAEIKTTRPIEQWIELFEDDYFNRRSRNPKSETTWRSNYLQPFTRLPHEKPLMAELLRQVILLETEPDTRNRQKYCIAYEALAKFAGITDLNATAIRGDYSPKRLTPRDLPTDKEVSEWRDRINAKNESWGWAFGIMATYGLRNHELFHVDLERLRESPVLSLIDDDNGGGKTGSRRVWAVYPEWWDKWRLWDVKLPSVTGKDNSALGNRVTKAFARYGFKKPYNLRHQWAVRTIEFGIPVELAAQQMGHSYQVHCNVYHYWISDDVHQRAFDLAMQRPDRPLPP